MTGFSSANLSLAENSFERPIPSLKGGKGAADADRKAEIRKVAIEFQSLFVEMMLKSMRETVKQDKLTGGGHGEEVYSSLLDREYATAISRQGNLGLAEMIERQLLDRENGNSKPITSQKTDVRNIEASHEN
jgi:Rod binding domain-containing protein